MRVDAKEKDVQIRMGDVGIREGVDYETQRRRKHAAALGGRAKECAGLRQEPGGTSF
jgi:hypothetical protein